MKAFLFRVLFIVLLFLGSLTTLKSQVGEQWVHSYQTGRVAYGKLVNALDQQGNVYYLMSFKDTVKRQMLTSLDTVFSNGVQMHLVKADGNGQIIWTQIFDNAWGVSLEIDGSGNIILQGDFDGVADFNPDSSSNFLVKSDTIGDHAEFLLKLGPNGNFKWVNCIGGFALQGRTLSIGINDNIVWGGMFYGTVDFDPTPAYNPSVGNFFDMFIQKVDSNGAVLYTHTYISNGSNLIHDMAVNSKGDLYAVGICNNIDFDPSAGSSPTQSNANFLVKYDQNGAFDWVQYWGISPTTINIDRLNDDIYVGGDFTGTQDFDQSTAVQNFSSVGGRDAFAIRLDSNAQFVWANTIGGTGNEAMQVMDYKNPYLTLGIAYENSVTVSTASGGFLHTSIGASDLMVLTYDSSQAYINTDSYGSTGIDGFHSITIQNVQTHYLSGIYENQIVFSPVLGQDAGIPYNRTNFFITKANQLTIGLDEQEGASSKSKIYPNPSRGIVQIESQENDNLIIYNNFGQEVERLILLNNSQRIDLSHLPRGVYYFQFISRLGTIDSQKVVLD